MDSPLLPQLLVTTSATWLYTVLKNAMSSEVAQSREPDVNDVRARRAPCTAAMSSDCSVHQPWGPQVSLGYVIDALGDDPEKFLPVTSFGKP